MRLGVIASLVVCVASGGCVEDDSFEDESQSIVGGTVSPSDRATVALVINGEAFCSGVLIEPTLVLTAAHCLPPNTDHALSDVSVFFGVDVSQGGTTISIADARANPEWDPSKIDNDIGIIELAEPSEVPPAALVANVAEAISIGDIVRAVGYGVSQPGEGNTGTKRSGPLRVETLESSSITLSDQKTLTCSGDSGGPLFATTALGEQLIGLHSRSNCESTALAERVDVHLDKFVSNFISGLEPIDSIDDSPSQDLVGGCQTNAGAGGPATAFLIALLALLGVTRRSANRLLTGSSRTH